MSATSAVAADAQFDVIVIGSGPAGQKAAIQAAKAGRRALVVEERARPGGACVQRGTIPSKTLRETALALTGLRRRSGGVIDVEPPPDLKLASLMRRLDEVVAAHQRFIDDQLRRNEVTVWHGRARLFSPTEVAVRDVGGEVRVAAAPTVVIAVGSRPRNPPEVPIDHEHILDSDSILSIPYLPRSLTVVGGGVIACEYACIFAALGVDVTILDRGARPLAFLDAELTAELTRALERMGARFRGGVTPRAIAWDGAATVVTLDDGEEVRADKLLYCVGREANLDKLGLQNAGLRANARGLLDVDGATFETAVRGVYAVGDVIGPPALAATAMEQGRRAVCHALGLPAPNALGAIPVGVYTIPELAMVGLSEEQARDHHGAIAVGRARFAEVARGQIAAVDDGLLKLVCDASGRQILGVHIVGDGAADLVHIGQVAMLAGWSPEAFVDNVFNFPTLAEAYRIAALDVRRHAAR